MTKTINAVELLKQVVQRRNWHQGRIERRLAGETKKNVLAGKLSYEKASAILVLLGWEKVKEESWKQLSEEERLIKAANMSGEDHIKLSVAATRAIYPDPTGPMDKKIRFSKRKG